MKCQFHGCKNVAIYECIEDSSACVHGSTACLCGLHASLAHWADHMYDLPNDDDWEDEDSRDRS